jgi:hypothetical protein
MMRVFFVTLLAVIPSLGGLSGMYGTGYGVAKEVEDLEPRFSASPRLTSTRQSPDTARSALTGRHPPAAREHSHLFWSESCAGTFFHPPSLA